jgi:hypothetical protein
VKAALDAMLHATGQTYPDVRDRAARIVELERELAGVDVDAMVAAAAPPRAELLIMRRKARKESVR